jgi:hypothetical protein
MRAMDLIVPVFLGVQFVVVLVALASAILFADPHGSLHGRNLR